MIITRIAGVILWWSTPGTIFISRPSDMASNAWKIGQTGTQAQAMSRLASTVLKLANRQIAPPRIPRSPHTRTDGEAPHQGSGPLRRGQYEIVDNATATVIDGAAAMRLEKTLAVFGAAFIFGFQSLLPDLISCRRT